MYYIDTVQNPASNIFIATDLFPHKWSLHIIVPVTFNVLTN